MRALISLGIWGVAIVAAIGVLDMSGNVAGIVVIGVALAIGALGGITKKDKRDADIN